MISFFFRFAIVDLEVVEQPCQLSIELHQEDHHRAEVLANESQGLDVMTTEHEAMVRVGRSARKMARPDARFSNRQDPGR
jgi:hypothetical protein